MGPFPIEMIAKTHAFLDQIGGEVGALIAPNRFHYVFLDAWRDAWRDAFPDARLFVEEDLAGKFRRWRALRF